MALTSGEFEHRLADDRAPPHDEVEDALRQPGAHEDVDDRPGAARHEVGRLEDHRVAVAERRRDLPRGDRDREIPRRDDADDADRLARHGHLDAGAHARDGLAGEPQAFAGEEIEDLPGAHRLADAVGERLAFLAREQPPDLLAAVEDLVRSRLEDVVALLDAGARPGRERRLGRGDRLFGVAGAGPRVVADDVVGVRRIDVGRRPRPRPIRRRCSCGAVRPGHRVSSSTLKPVGYVVRIPPVTRPARRSSPSRRPRAD